MEVNEGQIVHINMQNNNIIIYSGKWGTVLIKYRFLCRISDGPVY